MKEWYTGIIGANYLVFSLAMHVHFLAHLDPRIFLCRRDIPIHNRESPVRNITLHVKLRRKVIVQELWDVMLLNCGSLYQQQRWKLNVGPVRLMRRLSAGAGSLNYAGEALLLKWFVISGWYSHVMSWWYRYCLIRWLHVKALDSWL